MAFDQIIGTGFVMDGSNHAYADQNDITIMNAPAQRDLLKSLDRVIEKLESKLKSTRIHENLITSHPEKDGVVLSLKLEGTK